VILGTTSDERSRQVSEEALVARRQGSPLDLAEGMAVEHGGDDRLF